MCCTAMKDGPWCMRVTSAPHWLQVKTVDADKQESDRQLAEKSAQLQLLLSRRDSNYKDLKVHSIITRHRSNMILIRS